MAVLFGNKKRIFNRYDPDAVTFFAAADADPAGALTLAQKAAANFVITELKKAGLWTKYWCVYLMLGGTAFKHKLNAKAPGTFDLLMPNGMTHDANGITGNGTTQYYVTQFNPYRDAPGYVNNFGADIFACNMTLSQGQYIFGYATTSPAEYGLFGIYSDGRMFAGLNGQNGLWANSATANTAFAQRGFLSANRTDANDVGIMVNGGAYQLTYSPSVGTGINCHLGGMCRAVNSDAIANITPGNHRFVGIRQGLTETQIRTMQEIVTNYQTMLNRNPIV